ncbi:nitrite reductase (NO-forming) [Ruaniaceae bacterium KH17]|nr:nitrite reductase (NO-forming) [Ruaniaceae bacterium KH17]
MKIETARPGEENAPNRGFWPMRDLPTAFWLVLLVAATVVHRDLPEPRWLMIHLLFLGAITHAILTWSQYFSYALLRSRATVSERRAQNARLLLANGGAALALIGVPLAIWPLTIAGAAALIAAVAWHGVSIFRRARTSLAGKFSRTVYYYVAAAAILVIGAGIGAWMGGGDAPDTFVVSHALLNVLGWVGLTVSGTVVTLWPTILRTRADERSHIGAARALPLLSISVVVAALGAAVNVLPLLALGLFGYLAGLGVIGISLWRAALGATPKSFSALSVGIALLWWAGSVAVIAVGTIVTFANGSDLAAVRELMDAVVPYLAAGFATQILLGALSYLIPVVLGGGPAAVRTGSTVFDRAGTLRVAVANTALIVCALPVTSLMRVVASVIYLVAMASFLLVMALAMAAQSRAKKSPPEVLPKGKRLTGPIRPEGTRRPGQATLGMLATVLAVTTIAATDPMGLGSASALPNGDPDVPVMTVAVAAHDMTFTPNEIEVPVGTHLIIELTNTDASNTHDLRLANGASSARLTPGESDTIDAGVIAASVDGWCSIVGHKQMGMTLQIVATDGDGSVVAGEETDEHAAHGGGGAVLDHDAEPGADFAPYSAVLEPLPEADGPVTHQYTFTVEDTELEVAQGITQTLWTYNGTAPGPVLHGRVGDRFEITLVNDGTIGHSIDFHAGALAPDEPMRTIQPGESLTYNFTAERAGIWMYHCSTMPMTAHIANGMYGAVVIEPDGLEPVDHSYVLVQAEYYLGDHDGGEVDADKIQSETPDLVVFNGYADQYIHAPLEVTTGDRARFWVLNVGPNRASSFHIVGGQFDTVWFEGAYLLDHSGDTGSQAMGMQPAQGGFVELTFPEAGHYTFVSHVMIDAERGARGTVRVTDE